LAQGTFSKALLDPANIFELSNAPVDFRSCGGVTGQESLLICWFKKSRHASFANAVHDCLDGGLGRWRTVAFCAKGFMR
jgi:hypothetical protein